MANLLFTEKNFNFEAVTRQMFETKTQATGGLENKKKNLKFLIHLGFDCMLNNLSLDYMTGAELVDYLKAWASICVLPVLSKNEGGTGIVSNTIRKYDTKFVNPNEFVKKIRRFLVKNPTATAA